MPSFFNDCLRKEFGLVEIHPSLDFPLFESIVSDKLKLHPKDISIYYEDGIFGHSPTDVDNNFNFGSMYVCSYSEFIVTPTITYYKNKLEKEKRAKLDEYRRRGDYDDDDDAAVESVAKPPSECELCKKGDQTTSSGFHFCKNDPVVIAMSGKCCFGPIARPTEA